MRLGRWVALLLGCRMSLTTPFVADGVGHADSNQACGNAVVSPKPHSLLDQRAGVVGKTLGQIQRLLSSSHDLTQRGLLSEPTPAIRLGRRTRGKRPQGEVAQIEEEQ